jgi:hypothetical protein
MLRQRNGAKEHNRKRARCSTDVSVRSLNPNRIATAEKMRIFGMVRDSKSWAVHELMTSENVWPGCCGKLRERHAKNALRCRLAGRIGRLWTKNMSSCDAAQADGLVNGCH